MKDFFKSTKVRDQLRQAAAAARSRLGRIEAISEIASGDCFLFPEADDLPVRWAAALPHKDDPSLWYFVAADEYTKVGTCDVELVESDPLSPLAIRCGIGFWAHEDDVDLDRFVGRLNAETIAEVRNRLSEMVRGEVPITDHGVVAEANEEYREWVTELSVVCSQIEARMQSDPIELLNPVFDTSYIDFPIVAQRRTDEEYRLAADAVGDSAPGSPAPPSLPLDSSMPGNLLLQKDESTFDLVYYPASDDDYPPRLVQAVGLKVTAGKWTCGPDGVFTWTQPLVSVDGQVAFVLAGQSYRIAVS